MEQTRNFNLVAAGIVKHGEKKVSGNKQSVVDYGYFIAKAYDNTLSFLENRFNEKYKKSQMIHIRFINEDPLYTRYARYCKNSLLCYRNSNQKEAKQKTDGKWNKIECSNECPYKLSEEGKKPSCSYEATLTFLLPEVSLERVWKMRISSYTSIRRLEDYIALQKYLGNKIADDYYLVLNKEKQTTRNGKTFQNFILNIVRKSEFDSNNSTQKQEQVSTDNSKIVENIPAIPTKSESNSTKNDNVITETVENEVNITKNNKVSKSNNNEKTSLADTEEDPFKNYYVLVESYEKELLKDGNPQKYLFATFVDKDDVTLDVVIAPKFVEELSECDTGTTVILDLKTTGKLTITNNIKFVHKCKKNVVA